MARTAPFDNFSDEYDEWFEKNSDLYEAELEAIRPCLPAGEAEGMEVGVGSGKFAAPLGIKIGVEPSEEMAIKARTLGIDVYPGVAEELPFDDERFDFLLMVTTICFVDDLGTSFSEAFRVLKPSGVIVVGFVDRESEIGRQYNEIKETDKFYRDATFYSATEVLHYLRDAGFTIADVRQTLFPGEPPATVREGYGTGSFVVITGAKQEK